MIISKSREQVTTKLPLEEEETKTENLEDSSMRTAVNRVFQESFSLENGLPSSYDLQNVKLTSQYTQGSSELTQRTLYKLNNQMIHANPYDSLNLGNDLGTDLLIPHQDMPNRFSFLLDVVENSDKGPVRAVTIPVASLAVSLTVGALVENPLGFCAVGASVAIQKGAEKLEPYLPKDREKVLGYVAFDLDAPLSQKPIPVTGETVAVFLKAIQIPGKIFSQMIDVTSDSLVFGAEKVGVTDQKIYTAWDYTKKTGASFQKTVEDLQISPETLQKTWDSIIESLTPEQKTVLNTEYKAIRKQDSLPGRFATQVLKDPIRTDMTNRYDKFKEEPAYSHLEEATKRSLAARFAGSWTHEDHTTRLTAWSKKVIDNTDPKYSHLDAATRKNIVHFTIDGSLNEKILPDEAALVANRLATNGYTD